MYPYSPREPSPLFNYELSRDGITFSARNGPGLFKWSDVYAIFICADQECPPDHEMDPTEEPGPPGFTIFPALNLAYRPHYFLVTLKDWRVLQLPYARLQHLYEVFPYELAERSLVEGQVMNPGQMTGVSNVICEVYLDLKHHMAVLESEYSQYSRDSGSPHDWDDDYDVIS